MPRPASAENAAAQARQAKWRRKQAAAGRPEASEVDIAVAGAFAAMLIELSERDQAPAAFFDVIRTAAFLLEDRGNNVSEARRKLAARLQFRSDLHALRGSLVISERRPDE